MKCRDRGDLLAACRACATGTAAMPTCAACQQGLTPSTAAAATLLRYYQQPAQRSSVSGCLLARGPEGGFFATPAAPIPDLLSTATALHALAGLHADIGRIQEPCLDFIDTLVDEQGALPRQLVRRRRRLRVHLLRAAGAGTSQPVTTRLDRTPLEQAARNARGGAAWPRECPPAIGRADLSSSPLSTATAIVALTLYAP